MSELAKLDILPLAKLRAEAIRLAVDMHIKTGKGVEVRLAELQIGMDPASVIVLTKR